MGLDGLRKRLDTIDQQLLILLSKRAQVIEEVAAFKRHHNLPIYVPAREAAIIDRLRAANPGPLSGEALERIYRTIIEEMRKFEDQRVSYEPKA